MNVYGESAEITHQQNYGTFEKAIQAIIEDADSGALKEKVKLKRLSAKHSNGRRTAPGAGGRSSR